MNFSLDPVSEEPDVSASNLSLNEDTDASGSYSGVDLTNISVSLSDTSSLSNVTVTLSAVDSDNNALSGFTLEGTSTVSTGSYDSGTLTLTMVSANACWCRFVIDLDTLLGDVTLRPPEDFSGDATITVGVTATEQGAEPSQQTTADFTASVAAVAESPVFAAGSIVAQENSSEVGSLLEDQDIYLELPAATILQDLDGSETLSQVRIGGLNDIGGLGLVGSLVDETGASIGTSDGAGTTTLTAAQYAGGVFPSANRLQWYS